MWIKTTDKLPKENEQVILYWNEAYRGWYNWYNYTCLVWDDWESFSGITHWTPLPHDEVEQTKKSLILEEQNRIINIIHERIRGWFDKDCILTWIIEEIRNT